MSRSLCQMTFRYLPASMFCLMLCTSSSSRAQVQVTVNQQECAGEKTPCTAIVSQQGPDAPRLDIEGISPSGPGQIAIVSTGAAIFGLQDEAATVKGEPYQAQAVTEMKQTLADGSHIVQTTTAKVARDSDGRTVRIQKLSTIGPWRSSRSSSGDSQILTTIFDPVAKEHIDYTSDNKMAHVFAMPPSPAGAPAGAGDAFTMSYAGSAGGGAQGFAVQAQTVSPQAIKGVEPQTESLGTKTIEGIQAVGTRTTTTIPTGAIGNDKALVITRETWYSPELKLVIQSTQNDPRFGQTTYSLTNVQRNEPDAILFQAPADYKIDKVVPRVIKGPPPQ